MTNDHEENLAARLAQLAQEGESIEGMDPNDLAALVAGDVDDAERAALLERLAQSSEDQAVAAAVTVAQTNRATAAPRGFGWGWAVAAAIVVAVGGWLIVAGSGTKQGPLDDGDLAVAFTDLQRAEPELFADISPLLAAERSARPNGAERGGIQLTGPRGTLLRSGPFFVWRGPADAGPYKVTVVTDEGDLIFSQSTEKARLPMQIELEPGTAYMWKVETTASGTRLTGTAAFRMASAAERKRYDDAVEAIDQHVREPELRLIARAHLAIRLGMLNEALLRIGWYLEREGDGRNKALAEETRAWLTHALHMDD